jgi:ankyrin repeat protein
MLEHPIKIEQQELDLSQTHLLHNLAGIVKELIWSEYAEEIIAPAISIALLSSKHPEFGIDLIKTDFSTANSDPKLKAILSEHLPPQQQKFIPDLENAKKSSLPIFTTIAEHHGEVTEELKKELIEKLIDDPKLFDQKLHEELLHGKGDCCGFTSILSTAKALEYDEIEGVDKKLVASLISDLTEVLTTISTWIPGKKLRKETLKKIEKFLSLLMSSQWPSRYYSSAAQGELSKTIEFSSGSEVKKLQELASLVLISSKKDFKEVLKKLSQPNVIVFIIVGNHALSVFKTKKGTFLCYDCNYGLWEVQQDLNSWIEKILEKYEQRDRFFVALRAASFTYAGDYYNQASLDDVLKKQNPNDYIIEKENSDENLLFNRYIIQKAITSLRYFLAHADPKKIKSLIDQSLWDYSPAVNNFVHSIFHENYEIVELFVKDKKVKIDVNAKISYVHATQEIEDKLAKYGINTEIMYKQGYSPLECAAIISGSPEMIGTLVKLGATVFDPSVPDNAILIDTIYASHTLAALELLRLDSRLANTVDCIGRTPLIAAAQSGDILVMEKLLTIPGVNIDEVDKMGETALMGAAQFGNIAIMEKLLALRADVNKKDSQGFNALMVAIKNKNQKAIDLLQAHGAKFDPLIPLPLDCKSPLIFVTQCGNKSFVKEFLDNPLIEIDAQDNKHHTALYYAFCDTDITRGIEIAKMLLEQNGADVIGNPSIKDGTKKEIFKNAKTCKGHFECAVELLLKPNKKSYLFAKPTFDNEFLQAQESYPEYFEALLYKFLTHPEIFLKKFGISDLRLQEDVFQTILAWCNNNMKTFKHNANLSFLLGQLSYEGKYIKREEAISLLEKAHASLDLPTWKKELSVKLLSTLKAENDEAIMASCPVR